MGFNAPYNKDSDTSRAAAQSIRVRVTEVAICVGSAIDAAGPNGMIAEEIERQLGLRRSTVTARCWDLRQQGFIVDSLQRRSTSTGNAAMVFVTPRHATPEAIAAGVKLTDAEKIKALSELVLKMAGQLSPSTSGRCRQFVERLHDIVVHPSLRDIREL